MLFDKIIALPYEKTWSIIIEEYQQPLKDNLRSRIHICLRALAAHCGYSEQQFKMVCKEEFWPREIKEWRGKSREVPKDTMRLNSDEARAIEAQLYALAAELGCVIPQPVNE